MYEAWHPGKNYIAVFRQRITGKSVLIKLLPHLTHHHLYPCPDLQKEPVGMGRKMEKYPGYRLDREDKTKIRYPHL